MTADTVANQIFVRNINYNTAGADLGNAFKEFGEVTGARIITQQRFGEARSLGFGFVDFATPEAAAAAVKSTTPILLDGRKLLVLAARPRVPRKRDTIFVSSIPEGTTEDDLTAYFAKYNPIAVRIVRRNTEETRGFAFVQFDSEANQAAAHAENRQFQFRGAESRVQFARRGLGLRRPRAAAGPARAPKAPADGDRPAGDGAPPRGPRRTRRPRAAAPAAGAAPAADGAQGK
jgi:RNA recognition motif-containing protein